MATDGESRGPNHVEVKGLMNGAGFNNQERF